MGKKASGVAGHTSSGPTKADAKKAEEKKKKEYDKERAERKAREASDRTFGLENKNKSKVVQEQIKHMTGGVLAAEKALNNKKEKEARAKKEAEEQAARELEALFNAVPKSSSKKLQQDAKKQTQQQQEELDPKQQLYELFYGNDPEVMKLPVEERIEKAKKLIKPTTKLTTEVFQKWREDKKRQGVEQQEDSKAKRFASNSQNGREIFTFKLGNLDDDKAASAEKVVAPEDAPAYYDAPLTEEEELMLLEEEDDDIDEIEAMLEAEEAKEEEHADGDNDDDEHQDAVDAVARLSVEA